MSRLFDMALGARAATAGYEIGVQSGVKSEVRKLVARKESEKQALVDEANELIRKKNDRIAELELALNVRDAQVEGLKAQVDSLEELGVNSPHAFKASEASFADGNKKTRIRLIFEARFDSFLKARGIANPHQFRKD